MLWFQHAAGWPRCLDRKRTFGNFCFGSVTAFEHRHFGGQDRSSVWPRGLQAGSFRRPHLPSRAARLVGDSRGTRGAICTTLPRLSTGPANSAVATGPSLEDGARDRPRSTRQLRSVRSHGRRSQGRVRGTRRTNFGDREVVAPAPQAELAVFKFSFELNCSQPTVQWGRLPAMSRHRSRKKTAPSAADD